LRKQISDLHIQKIKMPKLGHQWFDFNEIGERNCSKACSQKLMMQLTLNFLRIIFLNAC